MISTADAAALGWVVLDEIDSTNAEAMRRALAGERGPLYIRADRQTAGRGRSGRTWHMRGGNLALSRLGGIACPTAAVPQLSLVAGVAVHQAAAAILGAAASHAGLRLKWPNDLLFDGAKLAGILVEATTIGGQRLAVVGIGLNLVHAPDLADRRTAALTAVAPDVPHPHAVARDLAQRLEEALGVWDDGRGFDVIRDEWLARALPLGTPMSVDTGAGGRVTGRFGGLDDQGYLLIELGEGGRTVVTVGDVALIGG